MVAAAAAAAGGLRQLSRRAGLAAAAAGEEAEEEKRNMADGVDHIDIYADVGEEFNQVEEAPAPGFRHGRAASSPAEVGLEGWRRRLIPVRV